MSGGSMNYLCYRVEEEAERMGDPELIDIVKDIANLLHDREGFLSGDYGDDEWKKSAAEFKQKWFGSSREERLKIYITEAIKNVRKECMELIGGQEK